ncbi:MAG: PAS domain S-box protein [Armatimonadetes bacterium]|nr:PAS domain S-box protein [Armatimonadota bacterium]
MSEYRRAGRRVGRVGAAQPGDLEAHFRLLADTAPVMIWTAGPDAQHVFVNQSWLDYTGRSLEQALGRGWTESIHPDDVDHSLEIFLNSFQARQPFRTEYRLRNAAGDYRWMLDSGVPRFGGDGRLEGFVGSCTDIHDLKTAEDDLQLEETRLEGLVASAMDAIISVDERHRIVLFNRAAEEMLRCPATAALGEPLNRFIPERYREQHTDHVQRFGETGVTNRAMGRLRELTGLRDDGTEFPIEASISQVRVGGQRLFTVILRDVTQRREMEQELRERTAALERSNEELADFAYVASHDLQAPLRQIIRNLELIEQQVGSHLDGDGRRCLEHSVQAATRLHALVQGLLLYARVERSAAGFEPVELGAIVAQVLDDLRAELEAVGATVEVGELPTVAGDAGQLARLCQNLLENALKFRGEQPLRVRITAGREGQDHRIAVADNGLGLEPRHAERIFVIFQRLHSLRRFQGNGLGLAICRRIVERHGGRIWVESQPLGGATFYFTLPPARSAVDERSRASERCADPAGGG